MSKYNEKTLAQRIAEADRNPGASLADEIMKSDRQSRDLANQIARADRAGNQTARNIAQADRQGGIPAPFRQGPSYEETAKPLLQEQVAYADRVERPAGNEPLGFLG